MYREIEHTADYAIHVTAGDLPALFVEAARGMNALTGAVALEPAVRQQFELDAPDLETLLVVWLEELAFLMESENQMLTTIEIESFSPTHLVATGATHSIDQIEKLIKAITFHDLRIAAGPDGYETTIVFDV